MSKNDAIEPRQDAPLRIPIRGYEYIAKVAAESLADSYESL